MSIKPMKESEDMIQIKFFNWMRKKARENSKYAHAFHPPNGGYRNKREAHKLKLMGVVAGVPDVFIGIANKKYHGLYIEFKTSKGRVSKAQEALHEVIRNNNYYVAVCRSADEAKDVVKQYEADEL